MHGFNGIRSATTGVSYRGIRFTHRSNRLTGRSRVERRGSSKPTDSAVGRRREPVDPRRGPKSRRHRRRERGATESVRASRHDGTPTEAATVGTRSVVGRPATSEPVGTTEPTSWASGSHSLEVEGLTGGRRASRRRTGRRTAALSTTHARPKGSETPPRRSAVPRAPRRDCCFGSSVVSPRSPASRPPAYGTPCVPGRSIARVDTPHVTIRNYPLGVANTINPMHGSAAEHGVTGRARAERPALSGHSPR
jgi:hypothetical protein